MTLRELVGRADVKNGIVFCNRKTEVDVVAKSLRTHGFDAAAIHGDLDQSTRTRTLESFRKGELRLLVASDVAARGLDIPDVSHVFNYDVPHHADDYVHRIGRTGRAGKTGETFMIVTPADGRQLDKVLKLIGKTLAELPMDLDWDAARERGERQKKVHGERGGDRGRGRGERAGRPSGRPRRAETPDAAPSALNDAPVIEAPHEAPRPARSRPPRANAAPAPTPRSEPSPPKVQPDADDRAVRGFGGQNVALGFNRSFPPSALVSA
jgi:superfamily II DNA/RNA helicase